MPEDRSIENKIIVLALLQKAREHGSDVLTRIQVHKLLFVSEQQMWRERVLSTGFRFIKMDHGPWSSDIENTMNQLERLGLVQTQTVPTLRGDYAKLASLTETGAEFVRSIMSLPRTGPQDTVLGSVEAAVREYGQLSSEDLARLSHKWRNLITGRTVHDTPPRKYLLVPRPRRQTSAVLELDGSVTETLEVMEDTELHESILASIDEARRGMFRAYRVGGDSHTDEGHQST